MSEDDVSESDVNESDVNGNDVRHDDPLVRLLDEPPIADEGFTAQVSIRLATRRRRRRVWVAVGFLVSLVGAAWVMGHAIVRMAASATASLAESSGLDSPAAAIALAIVVAVGLCGALWIDTEPLGG